MIIDSHCHLEYDGLINRREAVLSAARTRGVAGFLNISTKQSEWAQVTATAAAQPDVWASIGVHPHEADGHADVGTDTLIEAAKHPRVIGLGETGLDFYYDKSDRTAQEVLFRRHIEVARRTGLPVIIHTRDAEDATVRVLRDELKQGEFPALVHCFTGSAGFARVVLDIGLYISLSGIVTFKNAREVQEVAAFVPEDRLLVETDSPFLAPVPHRGKPCEPAFVTDTLAFVSALRDVSTEHLAAATTRNFFRLFRKAAQ